MDFPAYVRWRVENFFRRSRIGDEMEEELQSHVQHRADDLERSGIPHAEAERRARIEFGGLARFKEESREQASSLFLETTLRDARLALRGLRQSPGFAVVSVLTLALAIGANAVVFSVLNGLVLRPLNVPQPQSLYAIEHSKALMLSYPDYRDLRDHNRSFDGLAAYNNFQAGLDTGRNAQRAFVDEVSGNYFDVLGIQPYLGRFFHAADERGPNSAPYVVLGYAYWHNRFQDDRGVLGRTVQVNKHPFTIIGVAPPGFHGPVLFFTQDCFVPIVNQEQVEGQSSLDARGSASLLMTFGRLKAGVTPQQAIGDLNSLGAWLEKTYPKSDGKVRFGLTRPGLFGDFGGPPTRAFLTALMLLAGLILLAACANLGSLFAARAADRTRELALRLALGASRHRILRAFFTEALLISLVGGALGLWLGSLVLQGLSVWRPVPQFPVHVAVYPDASVCLVALLLTVLSGFLFGTVPVRQVLHTDPNQIVKLDSAGMRARRIGARDLLLVVQIALCAVLITSSMVAVRGYVRALHGKYGFEPQNAVLLDTDLAMAGYRGAAAPAMQKRMLEATQTIPGFTAVGLADGTPLNGAMKWSLVFPVDAADLRPSNAAADVPTYSVSPGYFQAAGTALLSGRNFTWHDDQNAPRVAVINQEFALRIFGSVTNATGKYYRLQDGTRVQVVGIAADGKYERIGEGQAPAVFFSILQSPSTRTVLLARSSLDTPQAMAAMKSKMRDVDSGLPYLLQTWNEALGVSLFGPRMATISLGVLGVMGAMLSVTGIFGMAAYSVSKRLKELGIRMALGAQRREVLQTALGRALKLLAFGSSAGLLLGFLAGRVLSAIVYQATPRDPIVLAGVVFAMALLGLLATWIPAQRVLSLDPMKLLREE